MWFHAQAPGSDIAFAALPFFLVLLAIPSTAGVTRRCRRLLLPYAACFLVYGLVHVAFSARTGPPYLDWWEWNMVVAGTAYHLWFLPFAAVVAVCSPVLRHPDVGPAAAVLAAGFFSWQGPPENLLAAQWRFSAIPVLVGFVHFSRGWATSVATLLACYLILSLGDPSPDNGTMLAGTLIALCLLRLRFPETSASGWCARCALPVYLVHPLVILAGQMMGLTGIGLGGFAVIGSLLLSVPLEMAAARGATGKAATDR